VAKVLINQGSWENAKGLLKNRKASHILWKMAEDVLFNKKEKNG
jgi:hypothetical protein